VGWPRSHGIEEDSILLDYCWLYT